ncbi:hypothetical protein RchiOBHm_Chr4g0401531 [Rosa chinensis]|uniref:Uncharacterized protein n=1 Tax=Rosa chinensis TaxID=74649 RepID=A0A2P6QT35_ROSCH|nr:hypothetical protein RchiOBHm_Chr4g0401531 [Rosa chinensis]
MKVEYVNLAQVSRWMILAILVKEKHGERGEQNQENGLVKRPIGFRG